MPLAPSSSPFHGPTPGGRFRRRPATRSLPAARAIPAVFLLALAPASPLDAQSVREGLETIGMENARLWVDPLARGIGHALTAGAFDRPAVLPAFHLDAGFRVGAAIRGEEDGSFQVLLPPSVTWTHPSGETRSYTDPYRPEGESDGSTPSALGQGAGVVLEPAGSFRADLVQAGVDPDDYRVALPPGLDLSLVPSAIFHASVGVGFGTELTVRLLPGISVTPELGGISGWGMGAKHEISRWLDSPFDLSVGVATQEIEVDGYLEASAFEGWLMAGKGLGPITVYGTSGLRRASVELSYVARNPEGVPGRPADGTPLRFTSDLDAGLSWGAGVRLQLLLMNLAGQYTVGDQNSFSLKVALAFP